MTKLKRSRRGALVYKTEQKGGAVIVAIIALVIASVAIMQVMGGPDYCDGLHGESRAYCVNNQ